MGRVEIFEVGPRDGLQSETQLFSVEERVAMIEGLVQSGLREIEVGSFVRDDRIPQLAGTARVLQSLRSRHPRSSKMNSIFWAFVPNEKGLDLASEAQVDGVSFFTAVSNTFALKNVNQSSADLLLQAARLIREAKRRKLKHRVYVSTMHHCPFEGPKKDTELLRVVTSLVEAGADEIVLSDTTGHSTPRRVVASLKKVLKRAGKKNRIAMHFHDTRGLALANVQASLSMGITKFDSSFGGLGGCPYAPGASGNLASEDLIYFLQQDLWLKNKIDLEKLADVSSSIERKMGRPLTSKVYKSMRGARGVG